MSTGQKNLEYTLQELVIKIAIMLTTCGIGLWCGWKDSYNSFYIAVLIQSINNMYDSFNFLKGYRLYITVFQLLAFTGGLISFIVSVLHFARANELVDNKNAFWGIIIALSIPIIHFVLEVYIAIRKNKY